MRIKDKKKKGNEILNSLLFIELYCKITRVVRTMMVKSLCVQVLAHDVEVQLECVRSVQQSMRHEEGLPGSLVEQLSEASMLLISLPRELEERAKYLETNQAFRLDHRNLKEQLHSWISDAERKMSRGQDGVDFENIINDLEEHKVGFLNYFASFSVN